MIKVKHPERLAFQGARIKKEHCDNAVHAIHLTIGYRRTQEQIASMVYTTSVSALGELLTAAARRGSGELVVQVGYFDNQEEVRSIVDQVQAMEAPEQKEPWTVNFYPEGGDVGIIEILLKKS